MKESRRILKEIYVGIALFVICFLILGAFLMRPYLLFAASLLIGGIASALFLYHIYDCLDRALDMQQKDARSFVTLRSMLRLIIRTVLMIGAIMLDWTAFVGVTIGLLSPKVSSYFNPQISKLLDRFDRVDDTLDIGPK